MYHLIVYVPLDDAPKVREAMASAGAGKIGNYDSCSFSVRGTGRFRPNAHAKPAIGKANVLEEVEEERIEAVVTEEDLKAVLQAVVKAHPYEEPAIHVWKMEDYHSWIGRGA